MKSDVGGEVRRGPVSQLLHGTVDPGSLLGVVLEDCRHEDYEAQQ
jgi:hypothetical protein